MSSSNSATVTGEGLEDPPSEELALPSAPSNSAVTQESPSLEQTTKNGGGGGESGREDSEEQESGEEGEGVGQMLRATVRDLEGALQDTRQLLSSRDQELSSLKRELDRYRQQAAREMANKTRLAQALDQSQSHTSQLEILLQGWQRKLQELQLENERLYAALVAEQAKTSDMESQIVFSQEKDQQIEALKSDLQDSRAMLRQHSAATPTSPMSPATPTSPIDGMQHQFLKQAIFHLLTESHAEEQLRAISSILNFSAQERLAIKHKREEKAYKR